MKSFSRIITTSLALCLPGVTVAQSCITPFTWKWWSNTAYERDLANGPGLHPRTYDFAMTQSVGTYLNTDLDGGIGPNGEGEITTINAFMPGISLAYVRTWSGAIECTAWNGVGTVDAYICNGSTLKADSAQITYNDFVLGGSSNSILHRVVLHELGHVFGFAHVASFCPSFMKGTAINISFPTTLNAAEVAWINLHY